MDGGRRVLRSLRSLVPAALHSLHAPFGTRVPALAGVGPSEIPTVPVAPRRIAVPPRAALARSRFGWLTRPGVGLLATFAAFAGLGLIGAIQNGAYDAFVAREGQPWDIAARFLGFNVANISVAGQTRMSESEILAAAGVGPSTSLPFLDADAVRMRLLAIPAVKSAQVMKLYPNRLAITLEERVPAALWQRDGRVAVVSDDGVAIDQLRDERYRDLPFVVGEGAEKRLPEFRLLLKSVGDLASRIRAGALVAGRRWDFQMTNGVIVRLSESDPGKSIETLLRLQRESHILDRDLLAIDLRATDRVTVRLTEEGVATREALVRKPHKSGG